MSKFERVSKYPDAKLPERKTKYSAGYDFYAAEDTLIPPSGYLFSNISDYLFNKYKYEITDSTDISATVQMFTRAIDESNEPKTLDEMSSITKAADARPTLIPTGIKAKLDDDTFLQLSVRSSCPLKYWLILANGVGIIDADYYNNPDNEGHIFFQVINLSPSPIIIKKGEAIGQGIILPYQKIESDMANDIRTGGFGSTT